MVPLKILINGAGIAGNSAAFWLSKAGHNVTVVEWFPTLRVNGLQLDLRGHGVEVMKRMGLEQTFRSLQAPEQGFQLVDSTGKRRAYFPANKSGKGVQDFTTEWEIMRGDLCRMIYDECKDKVSYQFGTSIKSFKESAPGVVVSFDDGSTDQFDLVIGADGQGSRLRSMLSLPFAAKALIPLGGYAGYFRISKPIQSGEEYIATWYLATNNRFVMTRRHSEHEIQAYMICTADAGLVSAAYRKGLDDEKNAFRELFKGAGWEVDALLKELEPSDDFYCERIAFVKLDAWSSGRVALVGDAAYCPSLMTGMGTTSAMVGPYILAGEITKRCNAKDRHTKDDLLAALQAYEQCYRPFIEQVQRGLKEDSWAYWPTSSFGINLINRAAGVAAALKLNVVGSWFLREKVSDWSLPDYQELGG